MSLTAENKAKIAANSRSIFELEASVNHNKARSYLLRSRITENSDLILANRSAAFLGNRQLANDNTDQIFRNRLALLKTLPTTTDVQVNFREAMMNKARLAQLNHRSKLNAAVLSISHDMAVVNAQQIAINRRIMEANEQIKDFNAGLIAENSALINASHNPTPESNATVIAENAATIKEIQSRVGGNNATLDEVSHMIDSNHASIMKNAAEIHERREAILKNHDGLAANTAKIAEKICACH
jgi:vacuolar-type H+-ATPase subunit I/STV1